MPRVLLVIEADATAVRRSLVELRADAESVGRALGQDLARGSDEATKAFRRLRREAGKVLTELRAEEEQLARTQEAQANRRAAQAQVEGNYRTNAYRQQGRAAQQAEEEITSAAVREGQRRVEAARREARERMNLLRDIASTATQAAQAAHGAIQAPRERMAGIEATLASAFGEGGASASEVQDLTGRALQFAGDRGLRPEDLAAALQGSQQQFSSLAGATPEARRAALERSLADASLARDAQADVGQVMRLGGAFADAGVDDTTRERMLRATIGAARRGGVEVGSLTQANLATIRARTMQALGRLPAGATAQTRSNTIENAVAETVSELEVLDPLGARGRPAGRAMQRLGESLGQRRVQDNLLTRIRNEMGQGSSLERQLFQRDAQGRSTIRQEFLTEEGGARFGEAIASATGNDPDRFRSLLGMGRRRGDRRQVLPIQQVDALALLAGRDASGRSGFERIRSVREGAAISNEDLERTRQIVDGLEQTRLNRVDVRGLQSARERSVFQRVSDAVADTAREHPVGATVLSTAGLEGARRFGPRAMRRFAPGLAGMAGGAVLTAGAVGGAILTYGSPANEGSSVTEAGGLEAVRRQHPEWFAPQGQGPRAQAQAPLTPETIRQAVQQGVQAGIQGSGGVPVRMNPVEQAHAQAQATGQRRPPAP